jgi:protein SCO1
MKRIWLLLCLSSLLPAASLHAHEPFGTGISGAPEMGIQEKTGHMIPSNVILHDEKGQRVEFGHLLGKPVILTLVYYTCEHICPQMLEGLAVVLPRLAPKAGVDFRVVTVSFDARDTPQIGRAAKRNYMKAAGASLPEDTWRFLTGDASNIQWLTEAVGFRFRKDTHGFTHPVVLILLSPEGKISGYFPVTKYEYGAAYPIAFSSFDLNVALDAASQGKPLTGLKRALLYCFSHEPPGQSRFFSFIGGIGLLTLAVMASFFTYLHATTKRPRKDGRHDTEG